MSMCSRFRRAAIAALFCLCVALMPQAHAAPVTPILVVTSSDHFTQYYAEILRAEGFNMFVTAPQAGLTPGLLAKHDVVILGQQPVSAAQVRMLRDWVIAGGNLIAMRPAPPLEGLLGIAPARTPLANRYFQINTARSPGRGLVAASIQYHGPANRYTILPGQGVVSVATLFATATARTAYPAVVTRRVGAGSASAFAFDVARSVVYTRQGNPAWAGQERDGNPPRRPNDLFFPDYLDLSRVHIPQADELQRLLGNLIRSVNLARRPLPHFWYLPEGHKAAILASGDDHATPNGTRGFFNQLLARSPAGCDPARWQCYRATSYIYNNTPLSNAEAAAFVSRGFELGNHVDTGCRDWTPESLNAAFAAQFGEFRRLFPAVPPQRTHRLHCVVWSDWASLPRIGRRHGVRLDLGYYYWPPEWVQNRPGFMNGSGFPMRYAERDGRAIDVYQAATHLVNENGVRYPAGIYAMVDRALGPPGFYGVFGTHADFRGDRFENHLIDVAVARSVPLVTAQQVLDWVDGRNASAITEVDWNGSVLSFRVRRHPKALGLTLLIPADSGNGTSLRTVSVNDIRRSIAFVTIKGVRYARMPAPTGLYTASYS
jgi:hypothetical protein